MDQKLKQITFLLLVLIIGNGTLWASGSLNTTEPRSTVKPNVILILTDDLGYGDVGFNGQQKIMTPNLDRFANEGMIFKQHYAGTSVCGP